MRISYKRISSDFNNSKFEILCENEEFKINNKKDKK